MSLTRRQTYMELDTGLGKARTLASKQSWLACSAKGLSSSGHLCFSNLNFGNQDAACNDDPPRMTNRIRVTGS